LAGTAPRLGGLYGSWHVPGGKVRPFLIVPGDGRRLKKKGGGSTLAWVRWSKKGQVLVLGQKPKQKQSGRGQFAKIYWESRWGGELRSLGSTDQSLGQTGSGYWGPPHRSKVEKRLQTGAVGGVKKLEKEWPEYYTGSSECDGKRRRRPKRERIPGSLNAGGPV